MTRRNAATRRSPHFNRRAYLEVARPVDRLQNVRPRTLVTLAAGLVASGVLLTTMWMSMALR